MYTISFWVKGMEPTANTTPAAIYSADAAGHYSTKLIEYKAEGDFDWRNVTLPAAERGLSGLHLGFRQRCRKRSLLRPYFSFKVKTDATNREWYGKSARTPSRSLRSFFSKEFGWEGT